MQMAFKRVLPVAALVLIIAAPAAAESYDPAALTPAQLLQHARQARGSLAAGAYVRVEHIHAGGVDRTETTYFDGDDYRTVIEGGGFTTESGSYKNQDWDRDENGIVTLDSDFRSAVDPNVLALEHPEDPKYNVRVLGLTQSEPHEYVLEANPPGGSDQFRYYDAKTYLLDRIVTYAKDRYRHVTDYSDYRERYGAHVAFAIHSYDGRPQNDDLTQIVSFEKPQTPVSVAIPQSKPLFSIDGTAPVSLPVRFTTGGIVLRVNVGTRGLDFLLDSGAAGLFIDPGVAHQLGLTPYGRTSETIGGGDVDMGRVRIPQLAIGPLQLHDVVYTTTPHDVDVDGSRVIGLMGFDLLASAVTEIDFKKQTVTVYPRSSFDPQAMGLRAVPLQLDDGIPRVQASIEHVPGAFLVDTGAFSMLAYHPYVDKLPSTPIESTDFRIGTVGGAMDATLRDITDFIFGGIDFKSGQVVVPSASTFDITDYDGIIGRNALSVYQLYFDYADRTLWLKSNI
jgi:predicted aspartyl protease